MIDLPKFACPHCGEEIEMPCCGNCAKFHQHYGHDKRGYFPMGTGHCANGRIRNRCVFDRPCAEWEFTPKERGVFDD